MQLRARKDDLRSAQKLIEARQGIRRVASASKRKRSRSAAQAFMHDSAKSKSEIESKSKSEIEPKSKLEKESESKLEKESKSKLEIEPKSKLEKESKSKLEKESESKLEKGSKSKSGTESETDTDTDGESESDSSSESGTESDSESETDTESDKDLDAATQKGAETHAEAGKVSASKASKKSKPSAAKTFERQMKAHDKPLREGDLAELPRKFCDEWLGGGRWARCGTEGKGSCFYWSICAALNYKQFHTLSRSEKRSVVQTFRCTFSKKMTEPVLKTVEEELRKTHSPYAGKSRAALADEFCDASEWANEASIRVVKNVTNANPVFINARSMRFFCNVHSDKTLRDATSSRPRAVMLDPSLPHDDFTVLVWWCNKSRHFEALVRLEDIDAASGEVQVRGVLQPACRKDDAACVRFLMKKYVESCAERGVLISDSGAVKAPPPSAGFSAPPLAGFFAPSISSALLLGSALSFGEKNKAELHPLKPPNLHESSNLHTLEPHTDVSVSAGATKMAKSRKTKTKI